MQGDVSGVRITPPILEFYDTEVAEPNNVFQATINVKNIDKSSKNIRFYGPKSENFRIKVKNPEKPVAPGLCVQAIVEYEPTEKIQVKDRLVITVDGDVIEVPILAYPSQAMLEIEKGVDFGNIVATSRVISREVPIINHGSEAGEFKILYKGSKHLSAVPASGVVQPNSIAHIKIECVTKEAGSLDDSFIVILDGVEKELKVTGNIVKRSLELLSINDEQPLECVKFGSTYYSTDKTEYAILYNNGPETINFVAIMDEEAVAQELGVDLSQTTSAALADDVDKGGNKGRTNILTSLITAIPNQGVLRPYEKIPVFFRFSPRWYSSKQGWKSQIAPPPRKDFALFMKLQVIGSSAGYSTTDDNQANGDCYAEVALTGTALPVLLDISPAPVFDFGDCLVGEHADVLFTLKNESSILPVSYQFKKIAHFSTQPPNGKITPGQSQDVIFSFSPRQVGTFKPQQLLEVLGYVADNRNPTLTHQQIIHTMGVQFKGTSDPVVIKPSPRFNPGITPFISNEVGMFVDETTFVKLESNKPRNALVSANKTRLHTIKSASGTIEDDNQSVKIAYPNDRSQSIRPSDKRERYQTIFTRSERHHYIDPDYAYTDEEEEQVKHHTEKYTTYIRDLRENRINKQKQSEFLKTNNSVDIGIKSAGGLRPFTIKTHQDRHDPKTPAPPNSSWKLLSTKELTDMEKLAVARPVSDGLNAVPTTLEEKQDASKWLTPQQLHQLIIGPPIIEFGKVCSRSVSQKEITIVNNLDQYVHIVAEIDCKELRQSSPLSQVVPPKSKAVIPVIFESNVKGIFQRSVLYTVNSFHQDHVTVLSEVVPVSLELSTPCLTLKPSIGTPADAGVRGVITLHNKYNYPAEFKWSPKLSDKGTAFSIRPATGTVKAFQSLDCEVVWYPSYQAPVDGEFILDIVGGTSVEMKCLAELGNSNVHFVERRIMFGQVPVNLTTVRTALLSNTGPNHAYFQVLDPNPFPGLTVSPVHGVVPVGGTAEIKVVLTPDAILKFDSRIQVSIKGGKCIDLRMGGTVESPAVDIDAASFHLGGVYCGSGTQAPFKLINKTVTKAKVEFDLTRYKDFSLNFPGSQTQDDYSYQMMNPGMFSVSLRPEEVIQGELTFMPLEVAAYDFIMPVVVNHVDVPSPAPTPFPPTPVPSQKNSLEHIINPRPKPVTVVTPRKHIVATALRQPLQISQNRIEFHLPYSFHDVIVNTGFGGSKNIILVNNSDKLLTWALDLSQPSKVLEKGIIKFLHPTGIPFMTSGSGGGIEGSLEPGKTQTIAIVYCPLSSGSHELVVPLIVNNEWNTPYQYLQITGELKAPKIWFDPPALCLTPVPLLTEISGEFNLLASQYNKITPLSVELPEVECEDGSKLSPLKVTVHQGQDIQPCCGDTGQIDPYSIKCEVTFLSTKPISFSKPIIFKDTEGRSFKIFVTATADNCILSCYPFLALHRTDHQIVCEQGSAPKGRRIPGSITSDSVGEAVIVPCHTPNRGNSRQSTSATSSNFQISSSSYESSVDCTDGTEGATPMPRDGAMNKQQLATEPSSRLVPDLPSRSLGSAMFPDEDSEEGMYHTDVLMAVQRWFTANGWPGGPFPIYIPDSLRKLISKKSDEKGGKSGSWETNNVKKDGKTIYDMISHLSGRLVPGIPLNATIPFDPVERVKQIHWQHSTLLTFIRCQGGSVAGIKAEHLMEYTDYTLWKQLQTQIKQDLIQQGENSAADKIDTTQVIVEEDIFEALSKRAWTDLLLQIMKCLVLAKITPRTLKNIATPAPVGLPVVNPDPLCSNIYGVGERILLTWLNHHYEQHRHLVWDNSSKGGVPASRWIVNYDMDLIDGLVLGAVLGAHLPFLIPEYLCDMYTHPSTAEQCLHNALKVVNAMKFAGIEYDIQAIDITDPNPVCMLLLCMHLYQKLPQYLPRDNVDFTGSLHSTVTRQVKITNSSNKSLNYHVFLAGKDSRDFHIPKGDHVTVPPKSTFPLTVEYVSRFLRPAEAVLVLVGRRQGSTTGSTMTFNLKTQIDNILPLMIVKVESPCYELERITLNVANPFNEGGDFKIILLETSLDVSDPSKPTAATSVLLRSKEKKKKRVKSKTDHGQNRPDTPTTPPPPVITDSGGLGKQKSTDDGQLLSAFSTPMKTVYLGPGDTSEVEVDFLPFFTGDRQCSVVFLNEDIGEFLYSIEAKAVLPLPSPLPIVPNQHTVRVSSAGTGNSRGGGQTGEDAVVFWKCDSGQTLKETLLIPVTNMTKERALILAAQQRMSELEIQRRSKTGTLTSSSVAAKTVKMLSSSSLSLSKQTKSKTSSSNLNKYTVEVDSEYYKLPSTLSMPSPLDARAHSAPSTTRIPSGLRLDDGIVELPVVFKAKAAGHYPAQVILRSPDDIRVYNLECTVNPDNSMAELELSVPVNKSITQHIPIVNMTNHDWPLKAEIVGEGFSGPKSHLAKAYQTAQYPLVFKPLYETPVQGKLILSNTEDGTDHVFMLHGKPEKPLAIDHIKIDCEARQSCVYSIKVPNATKKKQTFFVESDIEFTSGNDSIAVLPTQTGSYDLVVTPNRRGTYKGVLAFTASKHPLVEVDSDGDEIPTDPNDSVYNGYRIWFSVEIVVSPPPPERSLEIYCCCRKKTLIDVIVRNPTTIDIMLEASIIGRDLDGVPSITLPGGEKDVYTVTYSPSQVGKRKASLIFYAPSVGEFWYELVCTAEPPAPTKLQHMECELGRWTKVMITLDNPTKESLELIPFISNTNNFSLEIDNEQPLTLGPHSKVEIPLHFMPSTLGNGFHTSKISFTSKQFGEWVFEASGTGLLPSPQDPVSVYTGAGSNTTLIIPFRNPMDQTVLANVLLTANEEETNNKLLYGKQNDSPFCLLLKHNTGLRVPPKATLDIPVSFAPSEMVKYQSLCTVSVKRDDGEKWDYVPKTESGIPQQQTGEELPEIKWLFPIQGIPESRPVRDSLAPLIECQARETIEQRLEVRLAGVAPSSAGPHKRIKTRAITPKNKQPTIPDGIVVGETLATTNEFIYELSFGDSKDSTALQTSVELSLVRQHRDTETGLVVLVFNVVFNPFKAISCDIQLLVQAATGGLWKFPIKFRSTEPPTDDTIQIEASGLNKPSGVVFRLTSRTLQPVPFNAFFTAGSDQEICVSPQTGELLPSDTDGTPFVVNFKPAVYGKVYTAKLVIQTRDMQWSYNIRGVLPEYTPPRGTSSRPMAGPHPDPRLRGKQISYIQDNIQLLTTAVSSPIKGSKLVLPRVT